MSFHSFSVIPCNSDGPADGSVYEGKRLQHRHVLKRGALLHKARLRYLSQQIGMSM